MANIETVTERGHALATGELGLKIMEGNWWKFPPPGPGYFDVRQRVGAGQYTIYQNVQIVPRASRKKGGLVCMGMVCDTAMKLAGYEFRFPLLGLRQNIFLPYRVLYKTHVEPDGKKYVEFDRRESLLHKLPLVRSIEEARYVITRLKELWPEFDGSHIEYMEQQL